MPEENDYYEVPKDKLRKGVVFKKVYGKKKIAEKRISDAPAHLTILPHLEWYDNKP